MNTATPDLLTPPGRVARAFAALAGWRDSIVCLGPSAWKWAGLIGLAGATLDCTLTLSYVDPSVTRAALLRVEGATAISWAVQVALGLCAWAIADRSGVAPERRPARLATTLAVAALLQAVITPGLTAVLIGHVDPCIMPDCSGKDWSKVPWWLLSLDESGQMLTLGGLVFAWLEVNHRNSEARQRLLAAQQQRAQLLRSAFEARLTAMRAQVDPQFLFDSLADVQAAYARDQFRGAATLDRLIAYLRTALPRLHTEGSTVGAEAELVGAWLAVVAARHEGSPAWGVQIDPDCLRVPFPATVLLPLVQWAVGEGGERAQAIWLNVERVGDQGRLRAQLRVQPPRPCSDEEPAPLRVRQRLQALYGDAAALSCRHEAPPGQAASEQVASATLISVTWPDESADSGRC